MVTDLASAIEMIDILFNIFQNMREYAENTSNELATDVGESIKMPSITSRQVNRDNYDVHSSEDYYRFCNYI